MSWKTRRKKTVIPARHCGMSYKAEAVKLEQKLGVTEAARELGMPDNTLYGWVRRNKKGELPVAGSTSRITLVRTMSVVCFSVAPEYRCKGVATALLERVIADAKEQRYAAVEGYDIRDALAGIYEKLGFALVYERGGEVVMRKVI